MIDAKTFDAKTFLIILCSVNSAKKRNKEKVAETYDDAVSPVFLLFSFCNIALFYLCWWSSHGESESQLRFKVPELKAFENFIKNPGCLMILLNSFEKRFIKKNLENIFSLFFLPNYFPHFFIIIIISSVSMWSLHLTF